MTDWYIPIHIYYILRQKESILEKSTHRNVHCWQCYWDMLIHTVEEHCLSWRWSISWLEIDWIKEYIISMNQSEMQRLEFVLVLKWIYLIIVLIIVYYDIWAQYFPPSDCEDPVQAELCLRWVVNRKCCVLAHLQNTMLWVNFSINQSIHQKSEGQYVCLF